MRNISMGCTTQIVPTREMDNYRNLVAWILRKNDMATSKSIMQGEGPLPECKFKFIYLMIRGEIDGKHRVSTSILYAIKTSQTLS